MRKSVSTAVVTAALIFASLQSFAQESISQPEAVKGDFSISAYFSTIYSEVKEGIDTFFANRHIKGSCVDGIREEWDTNWWGGYVDGSLQQNPC